MNNIQHFLLTHEKAIVSIPSLAERIEILETIYELGPAPSQALPSLTVEEPVYQSTLKSKFKQDDWDELFADGGATQGSFDADDWGELHTIPIAADPTRVHQDI